MLVSNGAYEISSNREAGLGRYDILMRPRDLSKRGIIMELKLFDPLYDESVEETLSSALRPASMLSVSQMCWKWRSLSMGNEFGLKPKNSLCKFQISISLLHLLYITFIRDDL